RGVRKLKRIASPAILLLKSPVRVAVIGLGAIGPDHMWAYQSTDEAMLIAVSDVNPAALGGALDKWPRVRAYRDTLLMLKETRPDVVSVCTWPQMHDEMVTLAALTGVKGILCEKPLALRMDETEHMIAVCRARSVKLAGGHQYRFHPYFIAAA